MRVSVLAATALFAAVNAAPIAEPVKTVVDVVDIFTTVYELPKAVPTKPAVQQVVTTVIVQAAATSKVDTPATVAEPTSSSTVNPVVATNAVKAAADTSTQAATQAPSGGYKNYNGDKYAQRVLDHHNAHRANHSSPDVSWDANLASIAYQIANTCQYGHDTTTGGGGYGQNIAAGAPIDNITSVITDLFYNSEMPHFDGLYGNAAPVDIHDLTKFEAFGHFTQLVWKSTTKVGCASVDCKGRGYGAQGLGKVGNNVSPIFTVCNYSPPGNYLDAFPKNVLKPLGQPGITWAYKY